MSHHARLDCSCYCQTVLDNNDVDGVIPATSPQIRFYHSWAAVKETETQGRSHQKEVGPPRFGRARCCPLCVRPYARVCPSCPRRFPARPALPAAGRPAPPLPWASCGRLFVCEHWWRWRPKEGNRIKNALVPAGNGRQTRSPPPCLGAGQETLGRMPRRPGPVGISPDVWVVAHQHPDLHLDARSVLQLQDLGQMRHHLVEPGSLGFLRGGEGGRRAPGSPNANT